jgi:hypothetical protein
MLCGIHYTQENTQSQHIFVYQFKLKTPLRDKTFPGLAASPWNRLSTDVVHLVLFTAPVTVCTLSKEKVTPKRTISPPEDVWYCQRTRFFNRS